ncbi:MAG: hypothetical protein M1118_15595 [Chloroflexi bacterium]|nr:hypothetical protein [Chloroflexota bacterium]
MQPTYLDFLRELYDHVELSLSDAGLAASSSLDLNGEFFDAQTADEVADRLSVATVIVGQDWDSADPAVRRMLLHVAQLPFGTLRHLEERMRYFQARSADDKASVESGATSDGPGLTDPGRPTP